MSELNEKLGSLLKLERERQGLKLEEMSEKLKTAVAGLESIEAGNPDRFPSELYYTLFTKSYAAALGIDYDRTVEAIKEEIGMALEPSEPRSGSPDSAGEGPADRKGERTAGEPHSAGALLKKMAWAFVGLVGLLVAVLLFDKYFLDDNQFGLTGSQPSGFSKQPEQGQATQAESDKYDDFNWQVPQYEKPSAITLRLTPRSESWATILADGDMAIFRMLIPGRYYEAVAQYRLRVSVAVPSAVDIELNGRPVKLNVAASGRISRVRINHMNLESFFESERTSPEPDLSLPTPEETTGDEEAQPESTIGQLNGWRKVTMLGSNGTRRTNVAKRVSRAKGSPTL